MTAIGSITIQRTYFTCHGCNDGGYSLDGRLGIDGFLTRQAKRLACRAGAQHSFAESEDLLADLCGWQISDERLRQACHEEARRIDEWQAQNPAATEAFPKANGAVEFQTDGVKVNTDTGWRDMKIGIFAKRPLGASATPEQWDTRHLPKPSVRNAFASIESIDTFAPQWRQWTHRLGINTFASITVLGDGAEWIWDHAQVQFPGASGLLDIYHASTYISDAAKALFGDGTPEAKAWLDQGRQALLADGWFGICDHIGATLSTENTPERQKAVESLTSYLAKHTEHLNYRLRLHQGKSIGSGMVEGAAKNMIGKRLKQTGARWKVANANKMAELCCLNYSSQWSAYWNAA
jgi:hypothetical protein